MKTNCKKAAQLLSVMLCLTVPFTASAVEPKPLWVQKGVKSLNGERTNDSYNFQVFDTVGKDWNRLEAERLHPLMEYVGERYNVTADAMQLDSLNRKDGEPVTYRITFASEGEVSEVSARRVDEYSHFEEYPDNNYDFELYQLYAVSERNAVPAFDDFSLTNRYPAKTALMSIIPGLGQIYKGQSGKGYAIMGVEAAFVAGSIYSAAEQARYKRLAKNNPDIKDSYMSTATTFRQLRNVCLIAGGALYIYNIIDAAVAKGARRVVVKRPNNTDAEFAFAPIVTEYGGVGAGMAVRF